MSAKLTGDSQAFSRMAILRHLLIALIYTAFAAALAVTLPLGFANLASSDAWVIAALVLGASALLHEVFARFERDETMARQVTAIQKRSGELEKKVNRVQKEALRAQTLATDGGGTAPQKMGDIVAEVRVLQKLVEQLSTKRKGAPNTTPDTTPEKAAAVPAQASMAAAASNMRPEDMLDFVQDALRRDRIDLFLQPIVGLPTRQAKFYEAFSRIRADDGSFITPDRYLNVAEKEGLITPIDNLLLFRCVQIVRAQRNQSRTGFFINISKHTLADQAFFREFIDFMELNSELAPHLIFEFSQADLPLHRPEIASDLQRLARLGFRFSIDKVTSLNFDLDELHARRFKFVKIDIETLLAEKREKEHPHAIKAIRDAFFRNGIDLIVEKIEDEATLVDLLEDRIDYGQGYLFGEPKLRR